MEMNATRFAFHSLGQRIFLCAAQLHHRLILHIIFIVNNISHHRRWICICYEDDDAIDGNVFSCLFKEFEIHIVKKCERERKKSSSTSRNPKRNNKIRIFFPRMIHWSLFYFLSTNQTSSVCVCVCVIFTIYASFYKILIRCADCCMKIHSDRIVSNTISKFPNSRVN